MSPLPSFVELMQSLGLAPDSKLPVSVISKSHSRASSYSRSSSASPQQQQQQHTDPAPRAASPAIVVSQYDAPSEDGDRFKRRASSGNIKAARFSPYASTTRRGSMSALGDHQRDPEQHNTASRSHSHSNSSGSRRSSADSLTSSNGTADSSIPPVPPLPARRSRGGSLERLKVSAASYTPISSFARRRSPQASPTSPSFTAPRQRGTVPEIPSPVMLPTLPPMLAESYANFAFPATNVASTTHRKRKTRSRSPSVSPMDVDQETRPFVKHHQAGLRISSFHRQISPVA